MTVTLFLSGGTGNQFPISSIGGDISSTPIVDNDLNNLFDDVNRVEVINGKTEHRMFYIKNTEATNYLKTEFVTLVIPADTEISFAVDDSDSPQLLPTEDSTPTGLSFLKFSEWNTLQIPLGTFDINGEIAVWIKRKVLIGSNLVRTISKFVVGIDNVLTPTGDFNTIENSFDNKFIRNRSSLFFTDIDFVGEALLN